MINFFKKKPIILLLIILILATFLRVYRLNSDPVALFGDEVDVGYQAYSLLMTGRDISGQFLPTYLHSIAEYRAPLFIYSDVPFIALFGLNEWGVRLSAAFWGVISLIGFYLLSKRLFGQRVGLLASLLMAISPWHLQYSRAAFEVTMLLSFEIWATYLFLIGQKRWWLRVVSAGLFGLTFYIYSTANVFTPLLMLGLFLTDWRSLIKNYRLLVFGLITLLIVTLPIMISLAKGQAGARFTIVSIFQDTVELDKINIARQSQQYVTPDGVLVNPDNRLAPVLHNRPLTFGQVFIRNYLKAFSFDFLFTDGDPNFRQSIHEMGEMYLYELPFLILGIVLLAKKIRTKESLLTVYWLLIAPIPASLTYDGGFHATRLILMLPMLLLITGVGLTALLDLKAKLPQKGLLIVVLIFGLANLGLYLNRYYLQYPVESWRWWHLGFKQEMSYVGQNQNNFKTVIINNSYEPSLERYLFFTKYDPKLFQSQFSKSEKDVPNILPGVNGFTLDNHIYFGQLNEQGQKNGLDKIVIPGVLLVASARDDINYDIRPQVPSYLKLDKTVVDPFDEPIFFILEHKQ